MFLTFDDLVAVSFGTTMVRTPFSTWALIWSTLTFSGNSISLENSLFSLCLSAKCQMVSFATGSSLPLLPFMCRMFPSSTCTFISSLLKPRESWNSSNQLIYQIAAYTVRSKLCLKRVCVWRKGQNVVDSYKLTSIFQTFSCLILSLLVFTTNKILVCHFLWKRIFLHILPSNTQRQTTYQHLITSKAECKNTILIFNKFHRLPSIELSKRESTV